MYIPIVLATKSATPQGYTEHLNVISLLESPSTNKQYQLRLPVCMWTVTQIVICTGFATIHPLNTDVVKLKLKNLYKFCQFTVRYHDYNNKIGFILKKTSQPKILIIFIQLLDCINTMYTI